MMLLCCSFASASFTSRNIRSAHSHRLRNYLAAYHRDDLRRKFLDRGCIMPLEFFWPLYAVPSSPALPCYRFLETFLVPTVCSYYLLCQAWQTWACFLAFVQRACCHTGSGGNNTGLLSFLLWCHHTASPPIASGTHTSGLSRLPATSSNRCVHLGTVSRQTFGNIQETQWQPVRRLWSKFMHKYKPCKYNDADEHCLRPTIFQKHIFDCWLLLSISCQFKLRDSNR